MIEPNMPQSSLQGDPLHFVNRIRQQAVDSPEKTIMRYQANGQWQDIRWQDALRQIDAISLAMLSLGVAEQSCVGIWADNHPRWSLADFAILQIKAISTPLYSSSTVDQASYIIDHAQLQLLFVGNQQQYELAVQLLTQHSQLKAIIYFDDAIQANDELPAYSWTQFMQLSNAQQDKDELATRLNNKQLSDILTVIYTSGTTGTPKGVMLDYHNIAAQLQAHDQQLNLTGQHSSLSFLPLAHVFERTWSYYVLHKGFVNHYLEDPKQIKEALIQTQPTLMAAVPRFYEKIYSAIYAQVDKSSPIKRGLFHLSVWGAKMALSHPISRALLMPLNALLDAIVFKKIRRLLGGRLSMMPCGGAKLSPEIGQFFHCLGINVKLGYGMTETTATVCCWPDTGFNAQSIGQPMPAAQFKIGEQQEILVKGPMLMRGYLHNQQATDASFDADGFLRTGDAGFIDEQGHIHITDRIKELMKTSGGKYIAPQHVEGCLGKDPLIEQIIVFAEQRHFVSALIVPNVEYLQSLCQEQAISVGTEVEALIAEPKVHRLVQQRIEHIQQSLAPFEQVKRFTLISQAFSVENGQFTASLKLKRKVIADRYQSLINKMYQ